MPRIKSGKAGRRFWRVLVPGVLILAALSLTTGERYLEAFSRSPFPLTPHLRYTQLRAVSAGESVRPLGHTGVDRIPVEFSLRPGQTLSGVLAEFGLSSTEAFAASGSLTEHLDPRRIRAGDFHLAYFDPSSRLTGVEFLVGERGRLTLDRGLEGWESTFHSYVRRVETRLVRGLLEDSLITAIEDAGGSPILAFRMADVLQWDLDFNRDLRTGDRFELLFEEIYLDAEYHSVGAILALIYEGGGRRLEAYRFGEGDHDYYDGDGRPMRKMFLRSPLRFSRITSRFSRRRFHPVLKRYRPHYGVDYGAPVGTPVHATAKGVVTFAGWNRGGGKTVRVRHPNGYVTNYLHLSRFAKGIRPGARVAQGQVIGRVGSTGLSTGPHLDYRVQHRGKWIDPLSLKSVSAEPIPRALHAEFEARRGALRRGLETGALPPPPAVPAGEGVRLAAGTAGASGVGESDLASVAAGGK